MWPRFVNTAAGIWLMAAPQFLGYGGAARVNDLIVGPLAASFAIIAMWEATRGARWGNVVLGGWMIVASFSFPRSSTVLLSSLFTGAILILCGLLGGKVKGDYGGGWPAIFARRQ